MMERDHAAEPSAPPAGALSSAQKAWDHLGSSWQGLSQDLDHLRRDLQAGTSHALADLGRRAGHPVQRFQERWQRHQPLTGLAVSNLVSIGRYAAHIDPALLQTCDPPFA